MVQAGDAEPGVGRRAVLVGDVYVEVDAQVERGGAVCAGDALLAMRRDVLLQAAPVLERRPDADRTRVRVRLAGRHQVAVREAQVLLQDGLLRGTERAAGDVACEVGVGGGGRMACQVALHHLVVRRGEAAQRAGERAAPRAAAH